MTVLVFKKNYFKCVSTVVTSCISEVSLVQTPSGISGSTVLPLCILYYGEL